VEALSEALAGSGRSATKVVDLSGDAVADSAKVARESRGESVLYTIGPAAAEAVGEVRGPVVVSLGVANPARVRTPGAYVSIYPRLGAVFDFLKGGLKAKTVGLVFTPAQNREVGVAFLEAGGRAGVTVLPVPISSPGDLVRELKGALGKVDAVVLLVDPILREAQSLQYVVNESRSARKPTVGFLEDLNRLGVTVTLVAPATASAAAAVQAAREPVSVGKKRVEADGMIITVSRKEAQAVGLDAEAIGAHRIQ
jgi:putative ABC transport system substrate-binding protein